MVATGYLLLLVITLSMVEAKVENYEGADKPVKFVKTLLKKFNTRVKASYNTTTSEERNIESITAISNETSANLNVKVLTQLMNFLNCEPLPKLMGSQMQYSFDDKRQKIIITQICDRYFTKSNNNSNEVLCSNDKWIYENISCVPVTCPRLNRPTNSYMEGTSNQYGTSVYFSCVRGYTLVGNSSRRCEENGQWSGQLPKCNVSYCVPLRRPRHGSISDLNEVPHNKTVEFNCTQPYSLVGESVLKCLVDGIWDFPTPVCRIRCIVPNINGNILRVPSLTALEPGDYIHSSVKVVISCKKGHFPKTFDTVKCLSGKWVPEIKCTKACEVEQITGGEYTLSYHGYVVNYVCWKGGQMIGNPRRICQKNGKWSGKLPSCIATCILYVIPGLLEYRNTSNFVYLPVESHISEKDEILYLCKENYSPASQNYSGNYSENYSEDYSENYSLCEDGGLIPSPKCVYTKSRIIDYDVQILYNHYWINLCETGVTCEMFGYSKDYHYYTKYCSGDCRMMHNTGSVDISPNFTLTPYGRCHKLQCTE